MSDDEEFYWDYDTYNGDSADTSSSSEDDDPTIECGKRRKKLHFPRPNHHPFFDTVSYESSDDDCHSIHMLNDDCLRTIFSYCSIADRLLYFNFVCKRWHNLCLDSVSFTSKVDMKDLHRDLKKASEDRSLKDCQYDSVGNNKTSPPDHSKDVLVPLSKRVLSIMSLIGERLTHLQVTTYIPANLDHTFFRLVVDFCPNVHTLIFECGKADDTLSDGNYFVTGKTMSKVLANFAGKWKTLKMPSHLVRRGMYLGNMLRAANRLEVLDLSVRGLYARKRQSVVNGIFVIPYLNANAPLRVLNFSHCNSFPNVPEPAMLSQRSLDPLIRNWIERMKAENKKTTIEFILDVFSDSLECLNISFIDDVLDGLSIINKRIKKCQKMRELVFRGNVTETWVRETNMWDVTFQPIYKEHELICVLSLMPNLRVLDLTGNCDFRTNPGLIKGICDQAPLLEQLILKNCPIYSKDMYPLKLLKNLKKLCIDKTFSAYTTYCGHYNDDYFGYKIFVDIVLPSLKQLCYLSMEGAHGLSDNELFHLVKNAGPHLTVLVLEDEVEGPRRCWESITKRCCENVKRTTLLKIITRDLPDISVPETSPLYFQRTAKHAASNQ